MMLFVTTIVSCIVITDAFDYAYDPLFAQLICIYNRFSIYANTGSESDLRQLRQVTKTGCQNWS